MRFKETRRELLALAGAVLLISSATRAQTPQANQIHVEIAGLRNDKGQAVCSLFSSANPNVDHPRWSQAKERRLGEFLKRPTLMFNGYDQVASLYSGMDLKKNF